MIKLLQRFKKNVNEVTLYELHIAEKEIEHNSDKTLSTEARLRFF